MIHIAPDRDNINYYEVPDYHLVANASLWRRYGWSIVSLLPVPIWSAIILLWIGGWMYVTLESGFAGHDMPRILFVIPVPSDHASKWARVSAELQLLSALVFGVSLYMVAAMTIHAAWLRHRWRYRYQINRWSWEAFERHLSIIKASLLPGEGILSYGSNCNPFDPRIAVADLGSALVITVAAAVMTIGSIGLGTLDGPLLSRHTVVPWFSFLAWAVILFHVVTGITYHSLAATLACTIATILTWGAVSWMSPGMTMVPIRVVGLACAIALTELAVVLIVSIRRTDGFKLFIVTNQRFLLVTPPALARTQHKREINRERASKSLERPIPTGLEWY